MMTATSPVRSWAARALFRLRKFAAAGEHDRLANAEVLATFGPTRLRSRLKPLGRPIGTYDGTCVPACERERTKWCHSLPAKSDLCIESAFHRSHRRKGQRWPNRHFSPLGATFPSLRRSQRTKALLLAVTLALSTAGRSMDGPEERGDGLPGSGKGLNEARGAQAAGKPTVGFNLCHPAGNALQAQLAKLQ